MTGTIDSQACKGTGFPRALGIAVALAYAMLLSTAHAASAAPQIPLASVVLGQLDGYQLAAPGVGVSGPLTPAQLAQFAPDAQMRKDLIGAGLVTYGRTFVRPGGRQAVVIAFDLGTVAMARAFASGARESAADLGAIVPIAGVDNAFSVAVRPEKAPGTSTQEAFLQSGPVGFVLVLSDKAASPVSGADAAQLVRAQAAAVPPDIAARTDPSGGGAAGVARAVGYDIGLMLPIALIAGVVVVVRRRRRN